MKKNKALVIDKFTVAELTTKRGHSGKTDTLTQTSVGTSSLPCLTTSDITF
jgi:hypothetical protein